MELPTARQVLPPQGTAIEGKSPIGRPQRCDRGWIAGVALGTFIITLLLAVWRNDFPFYYHPDEPSKTAQIFTGERNFNHPPLMLTVASAVREFLPFSNDPQGIVQVGRWLSAAYLATANALLAALAGFYGGPLAAVFAGCLLVGDPQAILVGHYFKEDTLLLLGLALTFAAGTWRWQATRNRLSLVVFGAAAGVAVSAKYFGATALVYAALLETALPAATTPRWRRLGMLLLVAAAVVVVLNCHALIWRFTELQQAFFNVGRVVREGNNSIGVKVPHLRFVGLFLLHASPVAFLGLGMELRELLRRSTGLRARADFWLLALSPLGMVLVLSFSALVAPRYLLPVNALLTCAGSVGLVRALQRLPSADPGTTRLTRRHVMAGAALTFAIAWQCPSVLAVERNFNRDDRRALIEWVRENLPSTAVIAEDELAHLEGPVHQGEGTPDDARTGFERVPQQVLTLKFVADFGDLETMKDAGVTHVVVCWFSSRRFFEGGKRPAPGAAPDYLRRHEFYRRLRNSDLLIWKSESVEPFPLRPGLELYALTLDPQARSPEPSH